ncbi:MAG TPA: LysR family transcriptional regulator [Streptosporangiaceae bacterium]|jgi:DNA-binding transcriptional LysR family regulator|nr:LysR family transcriptional regulator [Streptosporangiaceae bacterium]
MEIRDLEYFLVCCRTGSFTAAAREVHIVQSAMSSAVARLEHELGVSLFDRSVTPVAVTEHGRALQAGARRVLETVQATRDEVAAVSGRVTGPVILGCTLHTGPLDLAAVLAALRDRHPGVIVQLRQSITGSAGNLQAVADGSMDIALTADPGAPGSSAPPRGVRLSPLVSEPLVFVCPDGHPLGHRSGVTAADLAGQNILRFPPGWGVRAAVEAVLGTDPSDIEIADYALMLKLIRDGFGTTLLPASALAAGYPGLRSVPADDPRLAWRLSAAVSASRQATAATEALLTALTQAAAHPTSPLPWTGSSPQPAGRPAIGPGGR